MPSRIIKTLDDAQRAINELQDWKDKLTTAPWDFHGLRITNASPSKDDNDYVIRAELIKPPPAANLEHDVYTAVFSRDAPVDGEIIPSYVAGTDRDGKLVQVWLTAIGAPASAALVINPTLNGVTLLTAPITLPISSTAVIVSNAFVSPFPVVGYQTKLGGIVITGGGATGVSMGIVVRRN